jgi:hypothetical protein
MLKQTAVVFLIALTLTSCAHKRAVKALTASAPAPTVTGTVIDAPTLAKGGNLALVPFKAGSGTEANDEMDRLSMMISRGIKDVFDKNETPFHVVDAAAGHPQIALQGYIQEFSKTGKLSRMMMRPNRDSLVLSGEVWLISTGGRLLSFSTDKKFNPKKQRPMDVAYSLGQDIGNFIISQAK